jgi:hypothetical protein
MRKAMKEGPMNTRSSLSMAGKLTVTALLVAAGGFVLQMASGVTNTPTVPPGLVTLLVAAGLVALLSWWWMPVVGSVAGLFNLIAFVVIGAVGRLVEPRILAVFHFPLLVDKVGHVIGLGFGVVLPLMVFFLTGSRQLSCGQAWKRPAALGCAPRADADPGLVSDYGRLFGHG